MKERNLAGLCMVLSPALIWRAFISRYKLTSRNIVLKKCCAQVSEAENPISTLTLQFAQQQSSGQLHDEDGMLTKGLQLLQRA